VVREKRKEAAYSSLLKAQLVFEKDIHQEIVPDISVENSAANKEGGDVREKNRGRLVCTWTQGAYHKNRGGWEKN